MTPARPRDTAREIARRHLEADDALGWFEDMYSQAGEDASFIPWADLKPNPGLVSWLDREAPFPRGSAALVIGCGLGDDAEELARRGFQATAFDISPTAVSWCRRRHPGSPVRYDVADLLRPPSEWQGRFSLVVESYTLQVLPPALRAQALPKVASFVAPGGVLLVVARGREEGDPEGSMPWPLTKREVDAFLGLGLRQERFEDFLDREDPPVRRFRISYRRTS